MTIRNINNNEFQKIQSLINNCGEYVTTYTLYAYWILSNYFNKTCKVAENQGKIIGFISALSAIGNKVIFIWQLCVINKYRNKGIVFQLIDNIVKEAKKNNYQIEFTVSSKNIASINLFTKNEFYKLLNSSKLEIKKILKKNSYYIFECNKILFKS